MSLYKVAAFTSIPSGGNPAGVWIGDEMPDRATMQRIAAEVGYSETAFLAPRTGSRRTIRYYSPKAEVSFCGHATIASGLILGESSGDGTYSLETSGGEVLLDVQSLKGSVRASLTSVATKQSPIAPEALESILKCFTWKRENLDPSILPVKAYAGAWHLVLALGSKETLSGMKYNFDALKELMLKENLTTIQVIFRESPTTLHARNPFPVGGVIEDPATGAAAAALGGYLRDAGLIKAPASIRIHQGQDIGRPSLIDVEIPQSGGIKVSGTAVIIPD